MKKVAKLIWIEFGVRVIVDENATNEQIFECAIQKIATDGLKNHICMDDIIDIRDDTECPYEPNGHDFDYDTAEHLLTQHLRACFPMTSEMEECDEEPNWDCIGGMQLCYDERNEEIRTGNWDFWSELPLDVRQYVLKKFMAKA